MKQVIWSATARRNLQELNDWYQQVSPDLPLTLTLRVETAVARLLDHPHIGSPVPDSAIRKWRATRTPFLLFYHPTKDGIRILKVRHSRSNWSAES